MIDRRSFIAVLIGGLLYGKAASAYGTISDIDMDALRRLSPLLIGLEKHGNMIVLRQGDINDRIARDLTKLLAPYRSASGFDPDGFVKDLESGKLRLPRSVNGLFLAIRDRAAAEYYTSVEGQRAAGYDGPPLKGYPGYHDCP